jgi:hypothetical protein
MLGLDKLAVAEPTVPGNSDVASAASAWDWDVSFDLVIRRCTFGFFAWIGATELAYVSSDDESTLLILVSPVV